MEFEWDEQKEKLNIKKHHISFNIAKDVLFVVYTERKEKIRIISARLATEKERSLYYDNSNII